MPISRRHFLCLSTLLLMPATGISSRREKTLTVAWPVDVLSRDPARGTPIQSPILKCVYDQPLGLSPSLDIVPALITRFRWLDRFNTILKLHFRNDVLFHNGQPFSARDFAFSFLERARLLPGTLLSGIWGNIERIETPDAFTAVVHFTRPMATALSMMVDIPSYVVPQEYYQKVGPQQFRAKPVGSGPYRLIDYQPGMHITLEANPFYWRGRPGFERITFLIVPDKLSRLAMLEAGHIDLSLDFTTRDAQSVATKGNLTPYFQPTTGITLLQMVNKGALQDRRVRLAMHHAINKPLISKAVFQGHALPVSIPAGKNMPGYDPGFTFAWDRQKAAHLLKQAGYSRHKPLKLNFYTTKGMLPGDLEIASAIAYMWKEVGIDARLQIVTPAMLVSYRNSNKFDGPLLQGWNPAAGDPATYSGLLLNPDAALSLWKSDDLRAALQKLSLITDFQQRAAAFKTFDRWQVSQGYTIPLFQNTSVLLYKPDLAVPENMAGQVDFFKIRPRQKTRGDTQR
jgi:peptide/nickel transport system substrate-binding protein